MPATRTPEGEPLRCGVCGAETPVEVSRPPGDSVCPRCGAHAWLDRRPATIHRIREVVAEIGAACREWRPPREVGRCVVRGMLACLAAKGIALWRIANDGGESLRALRSIARVGVDPARGFAEEIAALRLPTIRFALVAGEERYLIGVPVLHGERLLGVIEVAQRTGVPSEALRGYLQFAEQIAALVAESPSFSAGIV